MKSQLISGGTIQSPTTNLLPPTEAQIEAAVRGAVKGRIGTPVCKPEGWDEATKFDTSEGSRQRQSAYINGQVFSMETGFSGVPRFYHHGALNF